MGADDEIRVVGYGSNGDYDIDDITFSTGDWVQGSQHGFVPPEYEGRDTVREED